MSFTWLICFGHRFCCHATLPPTGLNRLREGQVKFFDIQIHRTRGPLAARPTRTVDVVCLAGNARFPPRRTATLRPPTVCERHESLRHLQRFTAPVQLQIRVRRKSRGLWMTSYLRVPESIAGASGKSANLNTPLDVTAYTKCDAPWPMASDLTGKLFSPSLKGFHVAPPSVLR